MHSKEKLDCPVHHNNADDNYTTEAQEDAQEYEQMVDDDEISIENESCDDTDISIDDLNRIEQTNMAQIDTDPELVMNYLRQMRDGELLPTIGTTLGHDQHDKIQNMP